MRLKIENEREARRCLKAAKAAGLTPGAWAREHGIDGRSLNAWRVNLSRSEAGTRAPRLIELVAAPPVGAEPRYVVRVGEVAIELGDDFRDESVVRLVRALRAC